MSLPSYLSAPILLTVYDRADHLRRCVESLLKCPEAQGTTVYISSDAAYRPEDVDRIAQVREYISRITGFAAVVPLFKERNQGLVESYYQAVNLIFEKHDRFIFLEDDVVVAPDFLSYMNEALEYYREDSKVFTVCAFSFSMFHDVAADKRSNVYFTNRFYPWGYGQWKSKALQRSAYSADDVDSSLRDSGFVSRLRNIGDDLLPAFLGVRAQGRMLVMDYLHTYHMVANDLVAVVPYTTKTFNIGHDGSGTRTRKSERFLVVNLSKHLQPCAWSLAAFQDVLRDESFNQVQFRNSVNRLKLILHRLGLLSFGMKAVNWYRGRR